MKTPDYLTYEQYKKSRKKKNDSKSSVLIAVTTFFVALLVFTAIAKSLSPNVDVSIGGDSETDAKETGLGVKKFIDDRLKMIQLEDNSAGVSIKTVNVNQKTLQDSQNFDEYSQGAENKINTKTKKDYSDSEQVYEEPIPLPKQTSSNPPRPKGKDLSPFETPSPAKMSKVYVGRYSSIEQARVAQEILMDSGMNITPFVKNMGGVYTLQVGSYGSKAKADGLASELQKNNFPARVVQE